MKCAAWLCWGKKRAIKATKKVVLLEEPRAALAAALAVMHDVHQAHVCPTSHAADYPPKQICSPKVRKRTQ